jgi:hypothetical protein
MGAHYTEKCNTQGDYWNKSPQEMGCFRIGPEKYNYNYPETSNLRDACGILVVKSVKSKVLKSDMLHIRSKLSLERSKLEAFIQEYEKSELLKRPIKEENYEVNREHKSI